jgi:DNA-binding HxlR family transcriptional regulator
VLGRMYEGQNCSAARALELVGERWSLLIIRDALFRVMTRFSDRLTAMGRDLQPVLIALTSWGDAWAAPDGPPIRYAHHTCGGQVHLRTHCTQCGQLPDAADVIAV